MKYERKWNNIKHILFDKKVVNDMGAMERDGYIFDIEYSVIHQKGALHVYRDGVLVDELTFTFAGEKPNEQQIETLIDDYMEKRGIY